MKDAAGEARELDEIVAGHLEALTRGKAGDVETLVARHPALERPLRDRLDALGRLDECLGQVRGLSQAAADAPAPRVAGYRVLERLGRGGMGVVFLAEQESLKRLVALKVLSPFWMSDPRTVERFRREAETIARLSHPGIVAIHQYGEENGSLYLAIDFVPGLDLGALVAGLRARSGPPDAAEARRLVLAACARRAGPAAADGAAWDRPYPELSALIVKDAAEALHFAHSRGILHRDVKPSNVILGADARPRLIDFGLTLSDETSSLTRSNDFVGSAPYCSPEQLAGDARAAGPAGEVFSLGAVLYELLSLRRPFDGKTLPEILARVAEARPRRLGLVAPWVPSPLEDICREALEKDPRRRYPTAAALAEDLRRFLDGRPVRARAGRRKERAAKMTAALAALALLPAAALLRPTPPPARRAVPAPVPAASTAARAPRPAAARAPVSQESDGPKARAYEMIGLKRYSEAIPLLAQALEAAPMDLEARMSYAEALSLTGDADAAEEQYALCETQAPKDVRVMQGRAAAFARDGNLDAAVDEYQKSLAPDSADARTHLVIAELLASLDRRDEAAYYYEKAGKLAVTDADRAAAKEGLERLFKPSR